MSQAPSRKTILEKICHCFYTSRVRPDQGEDAPNFKIKNLSRMATTEIVSVDRRPQDRQLRSRYPFTCPICMKFYNRVLVTRCCRHYVCLDCLTDIETNMQAGRIMRSCWYCRSQKLEVEEAGQDKEVRQYSDTPFGSQANGFIQPVVNWFQLRLKRKALEQPDIFDTSEIKTLSTEHPRRSSADVHYWSDQKRIKDLNDSNMEFGVKIDAMN